MNTEEFLDQDLVRNSWVKDHNLDIYLRKGTRWLVYNEDTHTIRESVFALDIANATAKTPGKGDFTRYLKYLEKLLKNDRYKVIECIYVENIMSEVFTKFLSRQGFKVYYPHKGRQGGTYPCAVKFTAGYSKHLYVNP